MKRMIAILGILLGLCVTGTVSAQTVLTDVWQACSTGWPAGRMIRQGPVTILRS